MMSEEKRFEKIKDRDKIYKIMPEKNVVHMIMENYDYLIISYVSNYFKYYVG